MTPTEQQMLAHIERMPVIDDDTLDDKQLIECERWMTRGMELVLRNQLELHEELRQKLSDELRLRLCKEITKEVMATLRNAGILR